MITRFRILTAGARGPFVAGALALLLSAGAVVRGQEPRPAVQPLVPQSLVGSVSFDLYCASCHGRGGRGDGPVAASLVTRPADLTMLARRNKGTFPRDTVLNYIEGSSRLEGVHGTRDMPVWGPTLRALEGSNARVTVRLENLVAFIASLQAPPESGQAAAAAPAPDGAMLFRTFCASCHGPSGRGDGTMASQMRRTPPDLTKFAMRNRGVFPSERVRQIIAGRGIASHGDRDMPVWGDFFKEAPRGTPDPSTARVDALVNFLAMLQERAAD